MNKTNVNASRKNTINSPVINNASLKNNTKANTQSNTIQPNATKTNTTQSNSTKTNNTQTNNKSNSSSGSGKSTFGIIILVVVIMILIGGSYWLYTIYSTRAFQTYISAELMPNITDATVTTTISNTTIPSSNYSNEYSISFWMNIDDYNYNYGTEKTIISRGEVGNPLISLGDKQNDLIVRVKLQGPSAKIISKFEDIPIRIPSQNTGIGFIQPELVVESTNNTEIQETFKKIGSNNIDYPTIQYTFDNNNTNCGYFDLISGNNVNNSNKINSNGNKLVEGFTNASGAINAGVKVMVDICNIAKTLQSQPVADNSVNAINDYFKTIINALEQLKTTSKSGDDVNKAAADSIASIPSSITSSETDIDSVLTKQFTILQTDIDALNAFVNVKIDYNDFTNAINTQMSAINCPIIITGANEIDETISFYENIINLMKKTLFTYISNMNSSIAKIYPELAESQGGSCLTDSYSNNDPTIGMCVVKMVPLQKWVNVIVSVYNQIIDIYIDGQLSSSCVLKGFPNISTDDINVTPNGGFSGKMARLIFMNSAVTLKQARDIYYSGPVATIGLFSMIPNWVYWTLLIIVIIGIIYSIYM